MGTPIKSPTPESSLEFVARNIERMTLRASLLLIFPNSLDGETLLAAAT